MWIGVECVQKYLREYFYRDKVGLVRGQRQMHFVTSQQMVAVVESGRDVGVQGRPIKVGMYGGSLIWDVICSVIFKRIDSSTLGDGRSQRMLE